MRHKFRWDKKYLYWGLTAFCVIAASILFYVLITRFPNVSGAMSKLGKILSPFIWGFIIAYLLTPLMRQLEKLLQPLCAKLLKKSKDRGRRMARRLSVFFSILLFLLLLAALIYMILPQLYSSIVTIVDNSPVYIASLTEWVETRLIDFPEIEEYITNILGSANENIVNWLQTSVLPRLGGFLTSLTSGLYYVVLGVYNLLIGIIVSIYILGNLERFKAGAKRFLYSVFSLERAEKIREGLAFTHKTFMGFISGKLLDSAIIGLICYVFCAALDMPYTLLVSIIIGVTNIIPFFGPLIGAVPSTLIILLVSPFKGLIFVIFIIVLQQVDGNIIGPKILGESTGINGFWVMFSIILGAGLFGFWGMLLGVPVFVVIYDLINKRVEKRLQSSELPTSMDEYENIERIDPVTHEIFYRQADPEPEEKPAQKAEKV
ncbi:MAG: AI-2E family transporter [Oscillospiraceae bacterium]|nr:AI-2E family transporter [Oscillospiraceae bacterium]